MFYVKIYCVVASILLAALGAVVGFVKVNEKQPVKVEQEKKQEPVKQPAKKQVATVPKTAPKTVAKKTPAVEETPEKKTYTREEFSKLVVGKNPAEVLEAVGKPDSTAGSSRGDQHWSYNRITVDPITGKIDSSAMVFFESGVVRSILY